MDVRRSVRFRLIPGVTAGAVLCALLASEGAASPAQSFIRSAGPVGAGRTLIVVNGGPGYDSQQMFRGFRGLASSSRRVVAYDQRGVGRTPAPHSKDGLVDYSLDAFVADLEAIRVRLGVQRIDVLGHSFGALVASAYAAAHPDRVRSLMLVSGLPMSVRAQEQGDERFERRVAALQRRGVIPKTIPDSCAERANVLLPVYVGHPTAARAIGTKLGPFRCDDLVGAIVNDAILADPRRRRLEVALARFHGPVLVAIGALDPFGAVWADDDASPLRGARVTKAVLPGAGHMLWLESPAFFPALRSFLAAS
jgi:pimeloyl-ACP methyl ester carboxylesterase